MCVLSECVCVGYPVCVCVCVPVEVSTVLSRKEWKGKVYRCDGDPGQFSASGGEESKRRSEEERALCPEKGRGEIVFEWAE